MATALPGIPGVFRPTNRTVLGHHLPPFVGDCASTTAATRINGQAQRTVLHQLGARGADGMPAARTGGHVVSRAPLTRVRGGVFVEGTLGFGIPRCERRAAGGLRLV